MNEDGGSRFVRRDSRRAARTAAEAHATKVDVESAGQKESRRGHGPTEQTVSASIRPVEASETHAVRAHHGRDRARPAGQSSISAVNSATDPEPGITGSEPPERTACDPG